MNKKTKQKLKYLVNKKSLYSEIKNILVIFKELPVVKNCPRP